MMKKVLFFAVLLMNLIACQEKILENKVEFSGLKENRIEILSEAKFEGFLIGADFYKNEAFIQATIPLKGKFSLIIVDIPEGKIKRDIKISRGAMESPTDFFNPSYMQYLDNKYIIIDQYYKIVFYDDRFTFLFANIFHMHRYFIDFFLNKGDMYLVVGEKKYYNTSNLNTIQLYKIEENKKPVHVKELNSFKIPNDKENNQYLYLGSIWPSGQGFEKDGKIYYANNDENMYYNYDIVNNRKDMFKLDYLKPKKFSDEAAKKIRFYNSDGWEERLAKESHKKVFAEAYPAPLYHFGIYDIGYNKIGIIGDLDPENLTFRLDVLDSVTGKYLESIQLPFGDGFCQNITTSARGMTPTYIDIDNGYYLWNNAEGDDVIDYARITHFKIIQNDKGNIEH